MAQRLNIINLVICKSEGFVYEFDLTRLLDIDFDKNQNMKNTTLLLAFIFSISSSSCKKTESADLAIQNVSVIDATGADTKTEMTVLINGNQIYKIEKTSKTKIADNVKVVDGSGKFLIPGLWDSHIHPYMEDKPIDVIGHKFISIYIANGITSVRVMLGSPEQHQMSEEIASGKLMGPRMLIASPLAAGPAPGRSDSSGVYNAEKGRQFVQESFHAGADFIKVGSYLPPDAYFGIANEAKLLGIPFTGHLPYSISGIEASDVGQHTLEHQFSILIPCSGIEEKITANLMDVIPTNENRLKIYANIDYDEQKARKLFTHFKENKTYVCPTVVVWHEFANLDKELLFSDPRLNYMPSDIRERWMFTYENFASDEVKADIRKMNSKTRFIIGEMNEFGIKILAGTDNGIPFVFQGFSLHKELELLVECGLTPMQALQAATINAAECAGRLDSLGTVEEGKIADLILLEENPLVSIENTKRINSVFYNGKHIDRSKLDEILHNIEKLVLRK